MKKVFAFVLGTLMAAALFVSCENKQNPNQDSKPAVKGTYELHLYVSEQAVDQQEVVKTVVTYPNNQGVSEEAEFSAFSEDLLLVPLLPFDIPHKETVTITQTLIPDVELTKDKYELGLSYSLTVKSVDDDDKVYDAKTLEKKDVHYSVRKENMAGAFPLTISLEISVDASGKVSISEK